MTDRATVAGDAIADKWTADAGASRRRLALVWSGALAVFGAAVAVLAAARLLAEVGGYIISQSEERRLLIAAAYHAALALFGIVVFGRIRRAPKSGPGWLRFLACLSPFLLLGSADRIAAYYIPPNYHKETMYLLDAELGWRPRPNSSNPAEFAAINSKGLRGPVIPYEKPDDEYRVVLLGDSVMFGLHVPYEQTFVAKLQDWASNQPFVKRVVFVNASVSSYSPWQELIMLNRYGFKYEPDLVLQGFCLNDVTQKFSLRRFGGSTMGHGIYATAKLEWSGLFRLARKISLWVEYGSDTVEGARKKTRIWMYSLFDPKEKEKVEYAWEVTNKSMLGIFDACRAAGVPVAVAAFPMSNQLEPAPQQLHPQSVLENLCAGENVPYHDLTPELRDWCAKNPYATIMLDDLHFNSAGHELVADLIADYLLHENLLPPMREP